MSQSHVAAERYVTGQKVSGSLASSGPGRAPAGFRVGATRAGGRDYCGEPDHVPARLRGPGPRSESEHIRFELESSKSVEL
jgi:hypothetical protein